MDPVIRTYPRREFSNDLWITDIGIAYQKDMTRSVPYAEEYFDKYVGYEGTDIARAINANRVKMVTNVGCNVVLDVGIGSGEFLKSFPGVGFGYDVNPVAVEWLKGKDKFLDPYDELPEVIEGITLWDVLEHVKCPTEFLKLPGEGTYVFISMPIFDDLNQVFASKHYRPDEHYYYYTESGLVTLMNSLGYDHLVTDRGETDAGREGILSFTFLRSK